jgi:hypothetical protein
MIRIGRMAEKGIEGIKGIEGEAHRVSSPFVLAYTYRGNTEEVLGLKKLASSWAGLGKSRLAHAVAQLANDLEMGITMGALSPGDTVYHIV